MTRSQEITEAYRRLKDDTEARALDEYLDDCAREASQVWAIDWTSGKRVLVAGHES